MTYRSTARRALVGAAGIAIAMLTALSVSGQAGASGPLQTGGGQNDKPQISISVKHVSCIDGQWNIEWNIANDGGRDGTVTDVRTDPHADVKVADLDLDGSALPHKDVTVATEKVGGSANAAKLTISVGWGNTWGSDHTTPIVAAKTAYFEGSCKSAPKCVKADQAHYSHVFNGPAGTASISYTGNAPLCAGESQNFLLVSYFAPSPRAEWPQYKFSTAVGTIDKDNPTVDLSVQVPPCFTQVDLVFGDKLINPMVANGERYNDRKLGSGGAPGNRSSGKPAWYNGGTSTCAMPAATMSSSCDGKVTVHLSNGADAHYAVPFKVKAGMSGDFVKEVSVEPGKSVEVEVPAAFADKITVTTDGTFILEGMWTTGHCEQPTAQIKSTCDELTVSVHNPKGNQPAEAVITYGTQVEKVTLKADETQEVTFKATDKTEVTVDFKDWASVTLSYDRPGDCAPPTPSPEPSQPASPSPGVPSTTPSPNTPGLPVTGVQVGVFAGIGALLLGAGAVLLLGARRRRLTEVE